MSHASRVLFRIISVLLIITLLPFSEFSYALSIPVYAEPAVSGASIPASFEDTQGEVLPFSLGTAIRIEEDRVLTEDVEADHILMTNGTYDLNGHTVTVRGDLVISGGVIDLNGGCLRVLGDLRMQLPSERDGQIVYDACNEASIRSTKEEGYLLVEGDLSVSVKTRNAIHFQKGTMELKGDLTQYDTGVPSLLFHFSDSSMLLLSGEEKQTLTFLPHPQGGNVSSTNAYFYGLSITNESEEGVEFLGDPVFYGPVNSEEGAKITGRIIKCGSEQNEPGYYGGDILLASYLSINAPQTYGGEVFVAASVTVHAPVTACKNIDLVDSPFSESSHGRLYVNTLLTCEQDLTIGGETEYSYIKVKNGACLEVFGTYKDAGNDTEGYRIEGSAIFHGDVVMLREAWHSGNIMLVSDSAQRLTVSGSVRFANLCLMNSSEEGVILNREPYCDHFEAGETKVSYAGGSQLMAGELDEDVTIDGGAFFNEGVLDLNGHCLTITGDLIQTDGLIDVGGGRLIVEGGYYIGDPASMKERGEGGTSSGFLQMDEEEDYVEVFGDFYISWEMPALSDEFHSQTRSTFRAGELVLHGDFYQNERITGVHKNYSFVSEGEHRVVLCADHPQTVCFFQPSKEGSHLGTVVLRNTSSEGVQFQDALICGSVDRETDCAVHGTVGILSLSLLPSLSECDRLSFYGSETLIGSEKFEGTFAVMKGADLTVLGSLEVGGDLIDQGTMSVEGELTVSGDLVASHGYGSRFEMKEGSHVDVGGSFVRTKTYYSEASPSFSGGTLTVSGDYTEEATETYGRDHIVILNGSGKQTVSSDAAFRILRLENSSEEGVYALKELRYTTLYRNGCRLRIKGKSGEVGYTLTEDETFEGDFLLESGELELNGHSLTITGDLLLSDGSVTIGKGELVVLGSIRYQKIRTQGAEGVEYEKGEGCLVMDTAADRVSCKDLIYDPVTDQSGKLKEGELRIHKDLSVLGTVPFSSHTRLILDGREEQRLLSKQQEQGKKPLLRPEVLWIENSSEEGILCEAGLYIGEELRDPNGALKEEISVFADSLSSLSKAPYLGKAVLLRDETLTEDASYPFVLTTDKSIDVADCSLRLGGLITNGTVRIGGGVCQIKQNLELKENAALTMEDETAQIHIGGHFIASGLNAGAVMLHGGVLTVRGNIVADGENGSITADGDHVTVFRKEAGAGGGQILETTRGVLELNRLELTEGEEYTPSLPFSEIARTVVMLAAGDEPPAAVHGLRLSRVTDTSVTIAWEDAGEPFAYQICRDGKEVGTVTGSCQSFTDEAVKPATDYVYAVYAKTPLGSLSRYAPKLQVRTGEDRTPPLAPKGLSFASRTGGSVTVSWDPAVDGGGVDHYIVLRDNEAIAENVTECRFKDSGDLEEGRVYEYRVIAVDGAGNRSDASEPVLAATGHARIEEIRPLDQETFCSDRITLSLRIYGGETVSFFYRESASEEWNSVFLNTPLSGTGNAYVPFSYDWDISGLKESGFYELRFLVTDEDGYETEAFRSIELDRSAPDAPEHVEAIAQDGVVIVSWNMSLSGDCEAYRIYRMEEGGDTVFLATVQGRNVVSYIDDTVEDLKEYTYYLRAFDRFDMGSVLSEGAYVRCGRDGIAPRILRVDPADGCVGKEAVFKVRATDNRSVTEIRVQLEKQDGTKEEIVRAEIADPKRSLEQELTWDTGELFEGRHRLFITAVDANGNTSDAFEMTVTVDHTGPGTVLWGDCSMTTSAATLRFKEPDEEDFAYFYVEACRGEEPVETRQVSDTLGCVFTGLTPQTTYSFRVRAVDRFGNAGAWSEVLTLTTNEDTLCPVIRRVGPVEGSYSNVLPLVLDATDNYGLKSLTIHYETPEGPKVIAEKEADGTQDSLVFDWDITDLPEGSVTLHFRATDQAGNESRTEEGDVCATYVIDHTPPATVEGVLANGDEGTICLTWTAADEAESYRLYRKTEGEESFRLCQSDLRGTGYTDGEVEDRVTYVYAVSAVDSAGNEGEASVPVSACATADEEAPEVLGLSPKEGEILGKEARFTALVSDNRALSKIALSYQSGSDPWITFYEGEAEGRYAKKTVSFDTTGCDPGQPLRIRISATDRAGNESSFLQKTYTLDHTPPGNTHLSTETESFYTALSWEPAADAVLYRVYRKGLSDVTEECIKVSDETSFEDHGGILKELYGYCVEAVDENGNTSRSPVVYGYASDEDLIAPVCELPETMMGIKDKEVILDGGASKDNVRIARYLWDFGDGTKAEGIRPHHVYRTEGYYTVLLTVWDEAGNSASAAMTLNIRDFSQKGMVELTAVNEAGSPIPYALLYVRTGSGESDILRLQTDGSGKAALIEKAGIFPVCGYASGYLPMETTVRVDNGAVREEEICLKSGAVVTADFKIHRLELEELVEAGIDLSDPENLHTYTFETTLVFASAPLPVVVQYYGGGAMNQKPGYGGAGEGIPYEPGKKGPGPDRIPIPPPDGVLEENEGVAPAFALLHVTQSVSWLKEMYGVDLTIINHSEAGYDLTNSNVSLKLPEGLSLAKTSKEQNLTMDLGKIPGNASKTVNWVIKGDAPGNYAIAADFHGTLMPFGCSMDCRFESEQPIDVLAGQGLHIYVYPENSAYTDESYYIQYEIVNESGRNFYNLTTTFGDYVKPAEATVVLVKDKIDGKVIKRERSTRGVGYHSAEAGKCRVLPVVYDGDTVHLGVFAPGEKLYGTYAARSGPGIGDPDETYGVLVDHFVKALEGKNLGVTVTVIPTGSHLSKYIRIGEPDPVAELINDYGDPVDTSTGAFHETMEVLNGGCDGELSMELTYNSLFADKKGRFGYGVTSGYEQYIEDFGGTLIWHSDSTTGLSFVSKEAKEGITYGELLEDMVYLDETMSYEGIYEPSSGDFAGYRILKSKEGYRLEAGTGVLLFDPSGRLCRVTDENGRSVSVTYTAENVRLTDEMTKATLLLTLNDEGMVTEITDGNGRCVGFSYDEEGNLTEYRDVCKRSTFYAYEGHFLTRITDPAGNCAVRNTYDEKGRVIAQYEAGKGEEATFTYTDTESGSAVTVKDHMGNRTVRYMDEKGNVLRTEDALGNVETYLYDTQGRLLDVWDPLMNNTAYEYDGDRLSAVYDTAGNVTRYTYEGGALKSVSAKGGQVETEYDEKGRIKRLIAPDGSIKQYTYDAMGHVLSLQTEGRGTIRYTYNAAGQKETETDYLGNVTRYEYDPYGNVSCTIDPNGNRHTYVYNEAGELLRESDGRKSVSYGYDVLGRMTEKRETADGEERIETYAYNEQGLLSRVTDALGNVTRYSYDNEGHKTRIDHPGGSADVFEYDACYRQTAMTTADGERHTYTYDALSNNTGVRQKDAMVSVSYYPNGKPIEQTDADGRVHRFGYDDHFNCIAEYIGDTPLYLRKYDAMDRLLYEEDGEGNRVSYRYDAAGNCIRKTDANGNEEHYRYDANGNVTSVIDAMGTETEYTYDALGHVTSITCGEAVTEYTYDAAGNLIRQTDPMGNVTLYTYDGFGNVTKITDATGSVMTNEYDAGNRWIKSVDAIGNMSRYRYDKEGHVTAIANVLKEGATELAVYGYDAMGRLTDATDAMGNHTGRSYDAYGNVACVTDAKGNRTNYTYDPVGRLIKEEDALAYVTEYTYNALGLLSGVTRADGRETVYTYDTAGRIKTAEDDLGRICYTYDRNGNVICESEELADGSHKEIRRSFDALNRVTAVTDASGRTVRYAYDELGNRISITYPGGEVVRYAYDLCSRLVAVTDWTGRKTTYSYDPAGRLIKLSRPDGSTEGYTYDAAGRMTDKADEAGGIEISHETYAYNERGQLTAITGIEAGGRIKDVRMTYDADNRMITYNGEKVTYDANGNMLHGPLAGGMGDYTYDCRNRLIRTRESDGTVTVYTYDSDDTKSATCITHPDGSVEEERYVTDRESRYEAVLSVSVTKTGEDKRVEETEELYLYGTTLLGRYTEGWQYYHFDHLGSVTAITTEHGAVTLRISYSAFGEVTAVKNGDGSVIAVSDGMDQTSSDLVKLLHTAGLRFLYNGALGVRTEANGLYEMGIRYYNPDCKRFISRDVLRGDVSDSQSLNRYAYVTGDPIDYCDPYGLCPKGFLNAVYGTVSVVVHQMLDVGGVFWDGFDLVNAAFYLAEGNTGMAAFSMLTALPFFGNLLGGGIKGLARGTKEMAKAEKAGEYICAITKYIGHGAQFTMSSIDL
nr:fibronectin type III domain-containing protein [Lachnospiraceae bacterium]